MALRICLLLAVVSFSIAEERLITPCGFDDRECIKNRPLTILSKISAGYPSLGIEPIDPLFVTSTDVNLDNDAGVVLHFKNINITGFKNSKLEYRFGQTIEQQVQTMEAEITIFSDVEIVLRKSNKTYTGTYNAKSTVRGKSTYEAGTNDVDGKKYFAMGPETTSCEVLGEPTVTLGSKLQHALDQDEDAVKLKPQWEANATTLRSKILCSIADNGFKSFAKSRKAIAKAYDVTQYYLPPPSDSKVTISYPKPLNTTD